MCDRGQKEEDTGMWKDMLRHVGYATFTIFPMALACNDLIGGIGVVEGRSMQPTLNAASSSDSSIRNLFSDRVILNRWTVRNRDIRRGDIVVMRFV